MDVTPREIIRRNIKQILSTIDGEHLDVERDLLALTVAIQQLLDLDEESQKPPMYTINPSINPWPPTTYPTWQPVPGSTIPSYPWWDSRNPYKITMTTDQSTAPTTYSFAYETPGYEEVPSSGGVREDFDDGEPVPA